VKRTGGDEPIGVVTHVHGNNTRNLPVKLSLSQTSTNVMFFFLSFIFFSSTKSENRRAEQVLQGERLMGAGRWKGKGV
jgi:hypothetical protein